jgi:hypothetical protein
MNENWIQIRLENLRKQLGSLETLLLHTSNDMLEFVENPGEDVNFDRIVYGQENVEGVAGLINKIQMDLDGINERITELGEEKEFNDIIDPLKKEEEDE